MLNEKTSGMRDTSIADKVILGKEISKSVKCFQKTQTFRVYDPSSVWEKKNRCTVLRNMIDIKVIEARARVIAHAGYI